jgi:preprotein translocase subunit YajC
MSTIVNMIKTLLIIIISMFLFLMLRQDNKSKKNTLAIVTIFMIVGYWLYVASSFINFNNL